MAKKSYGAVGYEPGKQTPFTPSTNAVWVDKYNNILIEENEKTGISRNKLTEKLLEEAVEQRLSENIVFQGSDLSPEERELLKSPAFQKLIIQQVQNMVQVTRNTLLGQQIQPVHTEVAASVQEQERQQEIPPINELKKLIPKETTEQQSQPEAMGNLAALQRFKKLKS